MKYAFTLVFAIFVINSSLFAQHTPAFDSSFAINGVGRYPLMFHSSNDAKAAAILQQSDGKIINIINAGYGDVVVKRLFENGLPDSSFGYSGSFLLRDGYHSFATAAALTTEDKIIITATTSDGYYRGFHIIRLDSEGNLDSSFNGNGRVMVYVRDSSINNSNGLAIQRDGKIIVVGSSGKYGTDTSFAIIRLNTDGSLDESFGQSGKVLVRPDTAYRNVANAVAIQQDNKIVITGASYRKNSFSGSSNNDIAVLRLNSDGTLDSSFEGNGITFIASDNIASDEGFRVAIQTDNKIVIGATGGTYIDFLIVRLNKNGKLDNSFGDSGKKLILKEEYSDFVKELKVLPTGKILIGGISASDYDSKFSSIYMVQLNDDGSNDLNFDQDGILFGGGINGALKDFVVTPDQKLLLLCDTLTIASLKSDGSIDSSFNNDGKIQLPYFESNSYATDVVITPDGKIVVAGLDNLPAYQTSDYHFAVLKLNKDGSPDSSFNSSGKVVLSQVDVITGGSGTKVAVQKDGKIVVVTSGYSVVRINKNGTIDSSFGKNGMVQVLDFTASSFPYQRCAGIAIQEDGKIIIAGNIVNPVQFGKLDYYVVRLNTDGSYDKSFSSDGKRSIGIDGAYTNAVSSIAISENNTVLVGGISYKKPTSEYEGRFSSIKLKTDGSLDSSFGKDGTFLYPDILGIGGGGFVLDHLGRILMHGRTQWDSLGNIHYYFIRLKSNAEFDSTFGINGVQEHVMHLSKYLMYILPQANGKILIGGFYNSYDCYFQQLLENGDFDSSFAQNGDYVIPTTNYRESYTLSIVNDSNGKIVLATNSQFDQPGYTFEVMRFSPSDIVLATTLLNITASLVSKDALISWQTANELNTAYFNLQRSLDGRNFYSIGKINATGNSSANYSYKDLNVAALRKQIVYYRLQQIDKDGSFSYSKIVSVTISASEKQEFSIYPNPARQKIVLVPINSLPQNKVQVRITDMNGKTLYTISNVSITAAGFEINVTMLAKGMYIVNINSDNKITKLKFLKE